MGRSNANRAQQKRERNAKKAAGAGAGSQLKSNEAAKTVQCKVCMQAFMGVCSTGNLKEHSDNKHPKHDFKQCFPDHVE
jgi:Zinc-binding/Small EDRK-rich factor 1/2-like, N-terminal